MLLNELEKYKDPINAIKKDTDYMPIKIQNKHKEEKINLQDEKL